MNRMRSTAVVVALGLVAAPALLVAAPAAAETTIDDVTFYGESDFGAEGGGSYPAGVDWFFGEVSGTEGAHSFGVDGLTMNSGLSGDVQILNQDVSTPGTAAELLTLLDEVSIYSTDPSWTFQLPMFTEPGEVGFTTLRPSAPGGNGGPDTFELDLTSNWITSQAFGAYAAGDQDTIQNLLAAAYAGGAPTLLAFGFFVNDTDDATIQGIWWDGWASAFTPPAIRTYPASISITDATSTGIPLSLAGAVPPGVVYLDFADPNGVEVYEDHSTPFTPQGTFSTSIVLAAGSPLGIYELVMDDDSFVYGFLEIWPTVYIEVTAAILPATGPTDAAALAGIAVLVLVGGAGMLLLRRRAA